jgi:uncharacterized protein (DUF2147 family)
MAEMTRRTLLGQLTIAVAALGLWSGDAAAAPTPVGYWVSIDDDGKTPRAVIQIEQQGAALGGRVIKLMNAQGRDPRCERCEGPHRNQPIVGMQIMWGLTEDGDEWSGGKILDPKEGKIYKCYVELIDGGSRLKVRGYIGVSLLGRTQYWRRASGPEG